MTRALSLAGLDLEARDWPAPAAGAGAGEAAPILLLHEGLGSVGLWRDFPPRLRDRTGRRVIAFSRYGHGPSGPPPRPRTPAFFHEEALEVLPRVKDALGVREPVLLGHSDGASIALIHAARHPVSALILLAPHVLVEEVTVQAIRGTKRAYLEGGLRDRLARHHRDVDAAFWGWCDVWLDPSFAAWSLEDEAGALTAPTLLIQGAGDPYGSLLQLERIEACARGPVQRLVVPGGHSPHLEQEDRVLDAMAAFLAGTG